MDFYNGHFNSPKLVYCLLIIFLVVLTMPGLAGWGRKSPIRNFRGAKATPLVIIYTPGFILSACCPVKGLHCRFKFAGLVSRY